MLKMLAKLAPALLAKLSGRVVGKVLRDTGILPEKKDSLEEIKKAESRFSKPFRSLKGRPLYYVMGALLVFVLLLMFVDLPETNLDLIHTVLGFIASLA